MKGLQLRVFLPVSLLAASAAQAQITYSAERWWDDRWYVAPVVQFTFPDKARLADNGVGYGLAVGKAFSPYWDLELRGAYESLPKDGAPSDWKNWTVEADGKWYFLGREGLARWEGLQPYGLVGIGAINDDVGTSKTSFMATAGLGVVLPLAKWGRFVLDGRYRWDANSGKLVSQNSFGDWVLSVGLVVPFGAAPGVTQPAEAKPPAPPPAVAAPAPPPPPPPPAPPPQPVTRTFDISADGMFAFDKAELTPVGTDRIENAIEQMRQAGVTGLTSMTIVGHTDPLGSPAYNLQLSAQRASAVRNYLVSRGIPRNIITIEGRGESQLKVTEADCRAQGLASTRGALIACLAPDRRVEIQATAVGVPAQ
jgi:OOP family OmpA-OmpF porin